MTRRPIAVSCNYNLEQCITTMITARCRRLPVIGKDKTVIGVVTIRYILEQIHEQLQAAQVDLSHSVYGKSVLAVISDKGLTAKEPNQQTFATTTPQASVYDAMTAIAV
jgi:predicted transcriptional regulator